MASYITPDARFFARAPKLGYARCLILHLIKIVHETSRERLPSTMDRDSVLPYLETLRRGEHGSHGRTQIRTEGNSHRAGQLPEPSRRRVKTWSSSTARKRRGRSADPRLREAYMEDTQITDGRIADDRSNPTIIDRAPARNARQKTTGNAIERHPFDSRQGVNGQR